MLTVHGGVLQQTPLRYPFAHSTRGCPATNTSQVPICSQCTGVSCNKHLSGTHLLTVHGGVLQQTPLRYPFANSTRGCPATNTSQVPICSQYTGVPCHKHLSGTHLLTVHGGVLQQTPLRYPFANSTRGCPATNTSQVPICSQYTGVSCNKHLSGTHLLTVHGGVLQQTPLRYSFAHSTRVSLRSPNRTDLVWAVTHVLRHSVMDATAECKDCDINTSPQLKYFSLQFCNILPPRGTDLIVIV